MRLFYGAWSIFKCLTLCISTFFCKCFKKVLNASSTYECACACASSTEVSAWTHPCPPKSIIKQSYRLECTFHRLGWHWKGAKKQKTPETALNKQWAWPYTSCDFVHKQHHVYSMQRYLLDNDYQQSNVLFSAQCFAGGTCIPGCTFTTEDSIFFQRYHCNCHSLSYLWPWM